MRTGAFVGKENSFDLHHPELTFLSFLSSFFDKQSSQSTKLNMIHLQEESKAYHRFFSRGPLTVLTAPPMATAKPNNGSNVFVVLLLLVSPRASGVTMAVKQRVCLFYRWTLAEPYGILFHLQVSRLLKALTSVTESPRQQTYKVSLGQVIPVLVSIILANAVLRAIDAVLLSIGEQGF